MIFAACSGFPGPVSRYWEDFKAVEITDTELGIPGAGTLRRWRREAPEGFVFTLLAPQEIAASGFRRTKENRQLLEAIAEVAQQLDAHAVVFSAPDSLRPSRGLRALLKTFVGTLPDGFPACVLDLPGFKPSQIKSALGDRSAVIAYDPLSESAHSDGRIAYLRLPGPAGRRSRYDDDALKAIAQHAKALEADDVFVVFRNIDMLVNGQALNALLTSG